MNKRLIFSVKILVMAIVLGFLGWYLSKAWHQVAANPVAIDWSYGGIALLGFAGSMTTSALVWRWLAWKMKDRSPTLPLLGAYAFSQMGKYLPAKVGLLLMRIERAGRFGMLPGVCTLSTILENALYMVSGGLVGLLAILRITQDLSRAQLMVVWPVTILAVIALSAACHPKVFYGLINRLLRRMKKPEIPASRRLKARYLAIPVLAFVPCWIFGGLALWASVRCVYPMPLTESTWFAGAFALSVIIGMASFLPAGLGTRDAFLAIALTIALSPHMQHATAIVLAAVAVALQRMFQIVTDLLLGSLGGLLTGISRSKQTTEPQSSHP